MSTSDAQRRLLPAVDRRLSTPCRELENSPACPQLASRPGLRLEEFQTPRIACRFCFRLPSHHLPICTLKKACEFRPPPVYSGFHSTFRNFQYCSNFPVIHIV